MKHVGGPFEDRRAGLERKDVLPVAGEPWIIPAVFEIRAMAPLRLSITRTENPDSSSRSTMWLPMKPAPPVTIATGADIRPRAAA